MTATHFATLADARAHLRLLTDAAVEGRPASYRRDREVVAAVDAERLRATLAQFHPAGALVYTEEGAVGMALPELGLTVEADSLDEAVADLVEALREYSEDWSDHLRHAPNHADHWDLVQIIDLSTDDQLAAWIREG